MKENTIYRRSKKKHQAVPEISVVVPIYNELANIDSLVKRLSDTLDLIGKPYEIIFIDDHSTDGTEDYLQRFSKSQTIHSFEKKGERGKAYSLVEGFEKARGEIFVMIDADLQYSPETLLNMIPLLGSADLVIANRKYYKDLLIRKILNAGFRVFFGKLLFDLPFDIQSGLKTFTRQLYETVMPRPHTPWTFDLEFLHKAQEAGFKIKSFDIDFFQRTNGKSKVNFFKTTLEIGLNALLVRFKKIHPQLVPPKNKYSMLGSGIGYRRKKYITHTTLPHEKSALKTFTRKQKVTIFLAVSCVFIGALLNALTTATVIIAILSFVYFVDVIFNLFLVIKSLSSQQEIDVSHAELLSINEEKLPLYSVICPLYREGDVVPQFLNSISKLDWPKNKLEVLLLLEEDDKDTIDTVSKISLPQYIKSIIVPHSFPKTKPKACNYGLSIASGKYIVIYDAEDIPDPDQLKKAYITFQKVRQDVVCLQAKLNYYNPHQNLLTRLFTAEYSLWFDLTLPGLQSINTSIPLGGTSNHFRKKDLVKLHGWDPFNVTEDADLGIRLFREGYKTAMINSTTYEEANSRFHNWMRQRSRWIKGYMQTYLVSTRKLFSLHRDHGSHALFFHLVVGGKIAFILINPILWIATLSYFAFYELVGPTIESFYPRIIFYMAATSLVFGNFLFLYYFMIGAAKRRHWALVKYVFFVPLYWIAISVSGYRSLYQLIFKPHYWEKTVHGFHLQPAVKRKIVEIVIETEEKEAGFAFPNSFRKKLANLFTTKKYVSALVLIFATVAANILNFVFNIYLGKNISLEDFGLVSLVSSFLYLAFIPLSALSSTISLRASYLSEKLGGLQASFFWKYLRRRVFYVSLVAVLLWLSLTPFFVNVFHLKDSYPILLFTPVWMVGMLSGVDRGFLSGRFKFIFLALVLVFEAGLKLFSAYAFVEAGLSQFSYAAIPIGEVGAFVLGWMFISSKPQSQNELLRSKAAKYPSESSFAASSLAAELRVIRTQNKRVSGTTHFPKKFFLASLLSGLSTMTFLSLDIILASLFLTSSEAGLYALVSLVGKIIFFLGSLSTQFITPLVGRNEGGNRGSEKVLYNTLFTTSILSFLGFVVFGIFGDFFLPYLFGSRGSEISEYVFVFSLASMCFTVSRVFVTYYLAKKIYTVPFASFFLAILQVILIAASAKTISSIVFAMTIVGWANLVTVVILHLNASAIKIFESNVADFFGLFSVKGTTRPEQGKLSILIFNWRDTKHKWAGGAEAYVHELAKRWVAKGNKVTIFCGNDGVSVRNQEVNGVNIVRRGGFYTVYIWAFLYYVFRFRGKFDVIIDSENGVPFFTPIYVRAPVFLLIHHIHQEVFRTQLSFPLSQIASFIEGKLMPKIYKNNTIITISNSSKKEIVKMGFGKSQDIAIVHPGIDSSMYKEMRKTDNPSFIYVGRLKPYKNVDVILHAFSKVAKIFPTASLSIVGEGERGEALKKLVSGLQIQNNVYFYGKVSDSLKSTLMSKSWVLLQPSMIEGWGITVIEANASGTPVIASDVNGLRDSVISGQTGVLVEVGNIDSWTRAMIDAISDEGYRSVLSRQALLWSKHFSWDEAAKRFYSVIFDNIETKKFNFMGKIAFSDR